MCNSPQPDHFPLEHVTIVRACASHFVYSRYIDLPDRSRTGQQHTSEHCLPSKPRLFSGFRGFMFSIPHSLPSDPVRYP